MLHASPDNEHRFRHEALLYDGEEDFLDSTVRFVSGGLEEDAPVLVATSAEKCAALRRELGRDARRVQFVDLAAAGRNPARIIPLWRSFLDEHGGNGHQPRGVGEPIWPERSPDEMRDCHQHEALLNHAFDDTGPWWLVCPYDRSTLDPQVIDTALTTHPHVWADGEHQTSPGYAPEVPPLSMPLDAPPSQRAFEMTFDAAALRAVRDRSDALASAMGLTARRRRDLAIAVSEVASNSIRHGGGSGAASAWVADGAVVIEVRDAGRISDALAGRSLPDPVRLHGRGLYIANQLCDLVQLHSTHAGTVVRLHMRLD